MPTARGDGTGRAIRVVIAAALAGPGLDATQVNVMRPPRGTIGRTMGFTVRSRAGVFELTAKAKDGPCRAVMAPRAVLAPRPVDGIST